MKSTIELIRATKRAQHTLIKSHRYQAWLRNKIAGELNDVLEYLEKIRTTTKGKIRL